MKNQIHRHEISLGKSAELKKPQTTRNIVFLWLEGLGGECHLHWRPEGDTGNHNQCVPRETRLVVTYMC